MTNQSTRYIHVLLSSNWMHDVARYHKKYRIIKTKERRVRFIVFLIHRTPSIKFHPQSWIWIKRLRYNFDITSTDWILQSISYNRCSFGVCSKNLLRKRKYFTWLLSMESGYKVLQRYKIIDTTFFKLILAIVKTWFTGCVCK